jgi:hypothetical protein
MGDPLFDQRSEAHFSNAESTCEKKVFGEIVRKILWFW